MTAVTEGSRSGLYCSLQRSTLTAGIVVVFRWGAALAVVVFLGGAAASAAEPINGGGAAIINSYHEYGKTIAAECLRNQAYGLGTGGLDLKSYCAKLGAEEAIKRRRQAEAAGVGLARGQPPLPR